ncbi:MAG: hypothetical protein ACXW31_03110 [Thermoanaerobaculia bacterium]
MNPVIPSPDPLPLPAHPSLLWALLMLTFFLHVIAMNFVLGGSILAVFARSRAQWLIKAMPTLVAAAITFGVAPLLFLQALYGRLFFSSSVLMAWLWFAIVPALILAYYGTYATAFRKRVVIAIPIVVALLFIGISFIQSNNMTLMLRPERFLAMYLADARGVQLNIADATLIPRWLHMLFGAIAVAGAGFAVVGVVKKDAWAMRFGALWFTGATLLNILTGIWWIGTLPREVLLRFMGGSPLATLWLGAGIALGFAALAMMFMAVGTSEPAKLIKGGAGATLLTVAMMIFARDEVRRGMFDLAGFRVTEAIAPQWDVIAIFAVLLVAALATTVWMGWTLVGDRRRLGGPRHAGS